MGRMFQRAYEVLQADKAVLDDESKAVIERDLEKKLSEYFELSGGLRLEIVSGEEGCALAITCKVERVKRFRILP
ncbi:MAG: hypothetical protein IJF39_02030 [Clostridia bacterium]|nr:hypothetical protein [Clostridia bacterium]